MTVHLSCVQRESDCNNKVRNALTVICVKSCLLILKITIAKGFYNKAILKESAPSPRKHLDKKSIWAINVMTASESHRPQAAYEGSGNIFIYKTDLYIRWFKKRRYMDCIKTLSSIDEQ